VLLGTMVARPALNSPILPLLFLASGLSGAAALLLMLAPTGSAGRLLVRAEAAAEGLELGLLGLYLIGLATSTAAGQAAAAVLMRGTFAWAFWALVVVLGLLAPLGVAVTHLRGHPAPRRAAILSGSLVLGGGLALRLVLVFAGQRAL
jgi:formate-dependent nitrite reductase membrane component NrfD